MKKFYTLALAAATVMSASAFSVKDVKAGTRVEMGDANITKQFSLNKNNANILKEVAPKSDFRKAAKKAKASAYQAPTKEAMESSFFEMEYYYYYSDGSSYNWYYYELPMDVMSAGEYASGDYDLVLYNFYGSEMAVLASYDETSGTISVPFQEIDELESNGTTYYFYFAKLEYSDEGFSLSADDYTVNALEDGSFTNEEDYWSIIYTTDKESLYIYDLCVGMQFEYANSVVEYSYTEDNEPTTVYRYQGSTLEGNVFTALNCFGYGENVEFVIDPVAATATATKQFIYAPDGATTFYYAGTAETPQLLVGEITGTNNNAIYMPEFSFVSNKGVVAMTYDEVYIIVEDDLIKSAGVSNITVDNANAPVEYFNLQGVKVDNPANGLFIKRQGTKSSKVLVK